MECFRYFAAQLDTISRTKNANPHLVIVRKMVDQRRESADRIERLARHSQRRPEAEAQAFFQPARRKNAGHKVGRDAKRLHPRTQRAMRAPR